MEKEMTFRTVFIRRKGRDDIRQRRAGRFWADKDPELFKAGRTLLAA